MNSDLERPELNEDLVLGAEAIAAFCGLTRWQVYKCIRRGNMPFFKLGTTICIRKSSMLRWIEEQESKRSR